MSTGFINTLGLCIVVFFVFILVMLAIRHFADDYSPGWGGLLGVIAFVIMGVVLQFIGFSGMQTEADRYNAQREKEVAAIEKSIEDIPVI